MIEVSVLLILIQEDCESRGFKSVTPVAGIGLQKARSEEPGFCQSSRPENLMETLLSCLQIQAKV